MQTLVDYKAQLERDIKFLNEKISSALSESTHKDDFARKQAKIAQEAIAGDSSLTYDCTLNLILHSYKDYLC